MEDDPGSVSCFTRYQEEIKVAFFPPLYKGLFNHFKLCYPEPSINSVILGLLYDTYFYLFF